MGKHSFNFNDCCCDEYHPEPCPPLVPVLSSYIEAVGNTQNVESGGDIVFDSDADYLDIAGYGIELDDTGTMFTITRPGLYHIEWSLNIGETEQPVLIGLMENGEPVSALSNKNTTGNHSSGALINVGASDIPFKISLRNFGAPLSLENPASFENTAVSIRILRFADGPEVIR